MYDMSFGQAQSSTLSIRIRSSTITIMAGVQSQRLVSLVQTTMPLSLPSELLDLIVDHLHDEPNALKACCVVDKSWIPRARKHLFSHVGFHAPKFRIESWRKTFPDPSNSPAHYTHSLSVCGLSEVTAADGDVGGWISTFRNVTRLRLRSLHEDDYRTSLLFRGLSPIVRSLHLSSITLSEAFDLICSFPLLEDLVLIDFGSWSDAGRWDIPLTSPKLTGSLDLSMVRGIRPAARRLLDLPDGLRFAKITAMCSNEDLELVTDLVSRCSGTLESLTVVKCLQSAFSLAFVTGEYLTIYRHMHV